MKKITDCNGDGCGECDVCRHLFYIDWVRAVRIEGSTVERGGRFAEIEQYVAQKYPAS